MIEAPRRLPEAPTPPFPKRHWPYALVVALLTLGLLVALMWPIRLPYFAMAPGPVEQVGDLITVSDASTYPPDGATFLLTVGLREVNPFEWFEARFLDGRVDLVDRDAIRPRGVTQEDLTRTNLQLMNDSIDAAVFVALARLGYDVGFRGEGVEVLHVVEGAPADGLLEVGDRFTEIAGQAVGTEEEAGEVIRSFAIGDTIVLSGERDGEPLFVEITLGPHPDIQGAPMVGVVFDTIDLEMVLPIGVEIDSRNIGGPSAGMMYAVTLLNLLTEEDLTKGHLVAGTGTIRLDETIGAIGGVRQKVFAARAMGIEIVFVPEDNYADALTAAGGEITVVPVTTLQDVLDTLNSLEPVPASMAAP